MNKIICDICGTSYPESSEACPICGCSSTAASEFLTGNFQNEDFFQEPAVAEPTAEPVRKKEIFDFDEVNSDDLPEDEDIEEDYESSEDDEAEYDSEEDDYAEEEEEEAPRHNAFVVILLTVLIVALLGAAAFIFVRFFLPNMGADETVPTTVAIQETEPVVTTEPTVPCQQMAMTNAGIANLNAEGQQFLLHIKALPENTTDKILYTSGDEQIATVTEDGKITAVSEGETIIYISCGKHSIECPVIVKYVEETVPPTTEAVAEETVPATEAAVG